MSPDAALVLIIERDAEGALRRPAGVCGGGGRAEMPLDGPRGQRAGRMDK